MNHHVKLKGIVYHIFFYDSTHRFIITAFVRWLDVITPAPESFAGGEYQAFATGPERVFLIISAK